MTYILIFLFIMEYHILRANKINHFDFNNLKHLQQIFIIQMDQSNNSDDQFSVYSAQNAKPNNRKVFTHKGLCIRSDFPGGNINQASFQQQFRMEGKPALVIQFWGNSDAQSDPNDKSWFYFSVSGIKENQNMKYQQIIFRFKNANTYRKFVKERKFRPYIVYRQEFQKIKNEWKTIYISKMNILQDQMIQAQFVYKIQPMIDKAQFSLHLPYNMSDLQKLNDNILDFMDSMRQNVVYYHREIIAYSIDLFPVYMFTITSINNVISNNQRQATLWPNIKGNRPYLLKNKPEIVLTARVHPAQTAGSFCVQGIIQSLIKNKSFDLLRQLFIFRIVPIINPDGVENGHYRLDNYLQNLNRFYGHSSPNKTPSIFAIQKLLTYLREKSKLFLFMDIHGHNSPKPSFIFGNYNQNFYQSLQNKTFVKVMQSLSEGNFSSNECQFSKKNMSLKQKYDEHSKQASARVFAYQGASQCNNLGLPKTQVIVEHSYTLEVHPYIVYNNFKGFMKSENSYRSLPISPAPKKVENILVMDLTRLQICEQYKKIGENALISILQLVGANIYTYSQEVESYYLHRKRALRQTTKFPQFYDRLKRSKQKQVNKELLDRYFNKWNILQSYRQYLNKNPDILQKFRLKSLHCPLFQIYDEHNYKKLKRQQPNLKNSHTLSKAQKMQQKSDRIILQETSQNLSEEQRREKYEFEKQLSKRKSSELKNGKKKSLLKSMEFQVLEKIQIQNKKERQIQIMNACSIKSCSPSLNPENNLTKNQYGYLDRKLKKLIFRHKTEMQKQYYLKNSKKEKLPFLYEIQFTDLENQFLKNEKMKELQNQYLKININKKGQESSVKKSNCRSANDHGIDESNSRIDQINQKISLNWKNFRNSTEHEQLKKFEKMNPRIEHLVKRISSNKEENAGNEEEKNSINRNQMHRIKSTKAMVSNLLISKSKKRNQTLESQKEYGGGYSPRSYQKQIVLENKSSIIPMIHQTKICDKILDSSENMELVGYQFPQCLIALNEETKKDREKQSLKSQRKQTNNKLLAFLERSKNNYNTKFIQRAKQILQK